MEPNQGSLPLGALELAGLLLFNQVLQPGKL